jgi:hypothetical protein
LNFLWCKLTITMEVTSNDKRDFGITSLVQDKQAEINRTRCQMVNKEMKGSNE